MSHSQIWNDLHDGRERLDKFRTTDTRTNAGESTSFSSSVCSHEALTTYFKHFVSSPR